MEIIFEVIIQVIVEGLIMPLIPLIGGFFIDSFLKTLGYKIDWGFAREKNPFLSTMALVVLSMIPIGIYNEFSLSTLLVFFAVYCGISLFVQLCYGDYKKLPPTSNILDDDLNIK